MVQLDDGRSFNLNDYDDSGTSAAQFCYYLDVIPPDGITSKMRLPDNGELIIGRSPQRCGLLVNDSFVSRVHLRVQTDPSGSIVVTDLYSAHGSKLDNRTLQPGIPMHWLMNQPISLGKTLLILRYGRIVE